MKSTSPRRPRKYSASLLRHTKSPGRLSGSQRPEAAAHKVVDHKWNCTLTARRRQLQALVKQGRLPHRPSNGLLTHRRPSRELSEKRCTSRSARQAWLVTRNASPLSTPARTIAAILPSARPP